MEKWILGYSPGDLVWLSADDAETIAGTVVNRSKTEVFVRTNYLGQDLHVAVTDKRNISHRDRDQVLTMAGVPIGEK
jgi:hypothetical protein